MADELGQGYERLRAAVLSGEGKGTGMGVVLHRGLAAWVELCSALVPAPRSVPREAQDAASAPAAVVGLLAQMVWARWEEGHS